MTAFYDELKKGDVTITAASRKAQIVMINIGMTTQKAKKQKIRMQFFKLETP